MSRIMNPGPPGRRLVHRQPIPDQRRREPTLVLDVDLLAPLPDIPGGAVARAWLMIRVGGVAVGRLVLGVPEEGLDSAAVGAAIAARIGTDRRRPVPGADDQDRSRSRGRISSE
jgi:hypothetical protein